LILQKHFAAVSIYAQLIHAPYFRDTFLNTLPNTWHYRQRCPKNRHITAKKVLAVEAFSAVPTMPIT
jgi:hypothetical protein